MIGSKVKKVLRSVTILATKPLFSIAGPLPELCRYLATSDRVQSVSVAPDLVEVELQDETRFSAGTLNLVFDRSSFELRQWTVTDQQGLQTMVALYNVETGKQLASDLFQIDYAAATNAAREKDSR